MGNPYIIKNQEIFDKENVNIINNLAYYLYLSKSYKNSIYLLNEILQKFPTRTVAYLNLADSYWSIGNQPLAKENYKKYIELMKSDDKDLKKISNYVWERIK